MSGSWLCPSVSCCAPTPFNEPAHVRWLFIWCLCVGAAFVCRFVRSAPTPDTLVSASVSAPVTLCPPPPGKAGGVGGSGTITPDAIIPRLRALAKDKNIAGEQWLAPPAVAVACVSATAVRCLLERTRPALWNRLRQRLQVALRTNSSLASFYTPHPLYGFGHLQHA